MSTIFIGENQYLAKTFFGLEESLAEELEALGATDIRIVKRAVEFKGDQRILYRANYELRTALRILKPLTQFQIHSQDDLYKKIKQINWANYLDSRGSLAIDGVVNSELFHHSKFAALRCKDAIADHFRERYNHRPDVKLDRPDLRLNLHINDRTVRLSMDSSGESLHKRGYRLAGAMAPLNEVLAAGMVIQTGWKGDRPLIDPMCGSGTILIEAALIAANQAPHKYREWFGFMTWKDFDLRLWKRIKRESRERERPIEVEIIGSDKSEENLRAAQENIHRVRLDRFITLRVKDFAKYKRPPAGPAMLITNPPYGERIVDDDLFSLYKMIGDQLKNNFKEYEAWIFSAKRDALKHVGLKTSKRIPLFNGPIECRFHKYELY